MSFTTDDLFENAAGSDPWAAEGRRALRAELLELLRTGAQGAPDDLSAAVALAEMLQAEFMAYGTSGGERLNDREASRAVRTLRMALQRLGIPWRPAWPDLTGFRTYWLAHEGYGSWEARRVMVNNEYGTLLRQLYEMQDAPRAGTVVPQGLAALADAGAIQDHLRRIAANVDTDPRLAVSVAKDLTESTAKLVLRIRGLPYGDSEKMPALVARAQEALGLSAAGIDGTTDEAASLKTILGSLARLAQGLAELRNKVGTGHGRESVPAWVRPRHARLAAGTATTWCNLMLETLADPDAPWQSGAPHQGADT